ncbi:MAG: hypothetical protein IPP10_15430 [Candidatus Competibacteraceae bacterium]|nr:hypothetical protein [Candidatus Competibacteraceae bacterium]
MLAGVRYRASVPAVGVRMEIHCWPEHDEARVYLAGGGGGLYQFIGTGPTAYKNYLAATGRYIPKVYAVLVEAKNGILVGRPLVSSVEAPSVDEWTYEPDPRKTDESLFCTPAHQWDGSGVRPHFFVDTTHGKRNVPWLVTQWQQSHPLDNFGKLSGEIYWYTKDTGYDFAPTLFEESAPNTGRILAPESNWYQSAALLETQDRRFIVMVDADNIFYCYPTSGYTPELQPGQDPLLGQKGNVPALYVKSQSCPWPTDADPAPNTLRPLWNFAPDGTKAVCVTAVREAQWGISAIYDDAGAKVNDLYDDYPVLVEVTFTVDVTGPNPEDFTFDVARTKVIDSRIDHRCPVAAGYAIRSMRDGAVVIGDLLILEYRHYTDLPEMCRFDYNDGTDDLYWPERPNKAVEAVVVKYNGTAFTDLFGWLVYYGCYPYNLLGVGDTGPRQFTPLIEDLDTSIPADASYWNHFTYIAQHFSIDLSSLCIGVSATLCTTGWYPAPGYGTPVQRAAEAQVIVCIAFGEIGPSKAIGHITLQQMALDLFERTATHPNLAEMIRLHLNAEISYEERGPGVIDTVQMTVTDGNSQSWEKVIEHPVEDTRPWAAFANCPLFTDADYIYAPIVYTFWDDGPYIRPGIAWDDGTLHDTLAFSGYRYVAAFHRQVHNLTLTPLNNVHQRIEYHRNGSWAVFAGPFAAHPSLYQPSADVPNDCVQVVYDHISTRLKDTDLPVNGTHIAVLAKAFGKTWVPADYFFEFREADTKLEFRIKADDPTTLPWALAPDYGPIGALHAGEKLVGKQYSVRVIPHFRAGDNLMTLNPYASFSPFLAPPTPKLEGLFPFPGV